MNSHLKVVALEESPLTDKDIAEEAAEDEAEDAAEGEEKEKIRCVVTEGGVQVSSEEAVEGLQTRGYGVLEEGTLTLTFYESLFLVSKDLLEVADEKGQVFEFSELLKCYRSVDDNAWVRFLIYRDLRSRGYVAREGFGIGIDFRVYERGEYGKATAKYLVFGVQEGQPVSVGDLAQALQSVQSLKKNLVLAVINRRGETVYYSLQKLALT